MRTYNLIVCNENRQVLFITFSSVLMRSREEPRKAKFRQITFLTLSNPRWSCHEGLWSVSYHFRVTVLCSCLPIVLLCCHMILMEATGGHWQLSQYTDMVRSCHHQETYPEKCHAAITEMHMNRNWCKEVAGDQHHWDGTKEEVKVKTRIFRTNIGNCLWYTGHRAN